MPTSEQMVLPKTTSGLEFESISKDILEIKFNKHFDKYGTKGYNQYGIDFYHAENNVITIGAQSKNYNKKTNDLISIVNQDIRRAMEHFPYMTKYIIITALNSNPDVIDKVLSANGYVPFDITFIFWNEIQSVLAANKTLLKKYYPSLLLYTDTTAISLKDLNKICDCVNNLIKQANEFHNNYKTYAVAYSEESDLDLYNYCVTMERNILTIRHISRIWYNQFNAIGIMENVNYITEQAPEFYDAKNDLSGSNLIYTVSNFCSYFKNKKSAQTYIMHCNTILEQLINYFNKHYQD